MNGHYAKPNNTFEMKQAMTRLWERMAVLFGSAWVKQNGDIGEATFLGWMKELTRLGSDAIDFGVRSVMDSGTQYAPNLNKFLDHCRPANSRSTSDLNFSEELHGGRGKKTDQGLPLVFTVGRYTIAELEESGLYEDKAEAMKLRELGLSHWQH